MSAPVTVMDHPLIQHKLSFMRRKETSPAGFRRLLEEVSMLMCYELTRDLQLTSMPIETPVAPMDAPVIEGKKVVLIAILRAGQGMLDGMLKILPPARVGHVGLYRDPETLVAVQYYFKVPQHMSDRDVIVVDPMLATGHSAVAAVNMVKLGTTRVLNNKSKTYLMTSLPRRNT